MAGDVPLAASPQGPMRPRDGIVGASVGAPTRGNRQLEAQKRLVPVFRI